MTLNISHNVSKNLILMVFTLTFSVFFPNLASTGHTAQVKAAVASNFTSVIKQLKPVFEKKTGHKLVSSFASSGTLFTQIYNGAPFDIFLSADRQRPEKLIAEGLAVDGSQFIFAHGQLCLWSTHAELIDSKGKVLTEGQWSKLGIRHIAIANPKTAPYGIAAMETLSTLGIAESISKRLVIGQNTAQTFQFVVSDNAQLGFLALAQILSLPDSDRGAYWLIPDIMYSPIQQTAVLLNKGENNVAAKAFLEFLLTPEAIGIINSLGYIEGHL